MKNPTHTNTTTLTAANGSPITQDNTSNTFGPQGPLAAENFNLFEKLAQFNRERIPERVVHARGTGAYGSFKLTKNLSNLTIANALTNTEKETPIFVRFSTVGGGQDSSDYARDPRGFAIKFYTDQGNWDIVGNNTPVFFLRDAIKFPDFIHSQKKNPKTNIPDPTAMYEFWAHNPQSLHQVTILMSDRGIPASYRHMNGYASHTLSLYNEQGKRTWVKWHFKTDQGIKTLTNEQANILPSHGAQEDLVTQINQGNFPSWTVKIQTMTEEQATQENFNPFDVTKIWPHQNFPLQEIGKLTLNKNVENYFAETEQSAFSPSHVIPGVGISPDRMLQARLIAYTDAHRYRLGANYQNIPVNAPRVLVNNYQRDGQFAGTGKPATGSVNFYPNSQTQNVKDPTRRSAPAPTNTNPQPPLPINPNATLDAYDNTQDDNFTQAGNLYSIMTENQKQQLYSNIAGGLTHATQETKEAMLNQFHQASPAYAQGVKNALNNIK